MESTKRVFASALGVTQRDAGWLRERLLEAAFADATLVGANPFGALYIIDFAIEEMSGGQATVRSGWIVRAGGGGLSASDDVLREEERMTQPGIPPMLAPVALAVDVPAEGLTRGQIGTVVEHLADGATKPFLSSSPTSTGKPMPWWLSLPNS